MANKDLERVIRTYRAFHESDPRHAQRANIALPGAAWRMGPCEFIGYMTMVNGKPEPLVHEFAPGSRPMLYAGPDRCQLLFHGGRYVVTGLGITDLDARGRVTEIARRYRVVRIR